MACFVAGRIARVALRIKRKNFRCGEASVTRGNAWFLDDRTKPPVTIPLDGKQEQLSLR